jgi:hypothetical protein
VKHSRSGACPQSTRLLRVKDPGLSVIEPAANPPRLVDEPTSPTEEEMKRMILMTVLGLAAAPAFAGDQPVALDDAALDKVSGGGDSVPVANVTTTTNTNVSPIVVVQNAYAVTYQSANTGNSAWGHQQGQANGHKKDKKNCNGSKSPTSTGTPTSTGAITQWATTQAFNIATINYTVTQH